MIPHEQEQLFICSSDDIVLLESMVSYGEIVAMVKSVVGLNKKESETPKSTKVSQKLRPALASA